MKTSELLREAKKLINTPEKWLKGRYSNDDLTCFCLAGAIKHICETRHIHGTISRRMVKRVTGFNGSISLWNDAPERTHSEVMDVMDRAVKLAEEEESRV